jgi:hypothetical protein
MKRKDIFRSCPGTAVALVCLLWLSGPTKAVAQLSGERGDESTARAAVGPGNTIVHSQFGGQILVSTLIRTAPRAC